MATRRDLKIGEGLTLPIEFMTMPTVVYGAPGSGKSTFGRVVAEEIHAHHQRFCAIDIDGSSYGLKSSLDGASEGIPVVIFGGDHADLPLEPGAGAFIAEVVADLDQSTIIDLSHLSKGKQVAFLMAFFERLYEKNREPLLLLLDEAQRYIPQKPMSPEATRCLGAAEDIVKLGRKRGLGSILFTQRGSGLNKEASELCSVLVAFRSPGVLDRKRISEWLEANSTVEQAKEILPQLSKLPTGHAIVASGLPELDRIGVVVVRRPWTFDSSATPKIGERRVEPKLLAQPDIEAISAKMAEAIDRAKADDPRELRKEITKLKQALAERPPETVEVEVEVERVVEKPVPYLTPEAERSITALIEQLEGALNLDTLRAVGPGLLDARVVASTRVPPPPPPPSERPRVAPKPPVDREVSGDTTVNKAERSFLGALAQFPTGLTKARAAFLAGYAPTVSTTRNTLSALRTKGLISGMGTDGDQLRITDSGRDVLGDDWEPAPTGTALVEFWYVKLDKAQKAFFRGIADAHPQPLTKEQAAQAAGYDPAVSTTRNTLSSLRTLGLIEGFEAIRLSGALVGG